MKQKWTISAGIYEQNQVVYCNRLNLYFAQEPINKQLYAFRDFEDESEMNRFVMKILQELYDSQGEAFKLKYEQFKQEKEVVIYTLIIKAEPKI
jgi:hypothetical protein